LEASVTIYHLTWYNIPEDSDLEEPSLQMLAANEGHVIAEICWTTRTRVHCVLMAIILVIHRSVTRYCGTCSCQHSVQVSCLGVFFFSFSLFIYLFLCITVTTKCWSLFPEIICGRRTYVTFFCNFICYPTFVRFVVVHLFEALHHKLKGCGFDL
jgi:hypothetical protein